MDSPPPLPLPLPSFPLPGLPPGCPQATLRSPAVMKIGLFKPAQTSFPPNFNNKTTSVAEICVISSLPHYLIPLVFDVQIIMRFILYCTSCLLRFFQFVKLGFFFESSNLLKSSQILITKKIKKKFAQVQRFVCFLCL
jgi:hypothetical protein